MQKGNNMWQQIFGVIAIIALVWIFFWFKKRNPDMFSKQAMSKSFTTVGILALALIAFVALLAILAKA